MQILITGPLDPPFLARVTQTFPDVRFVEQDAWDESPGDAVFAWEVELPMIARALQVCPDLPWLHQRYAGVQPALLDLLDGHPTLLTSGSGAYGRPLAEFVVGATVAFYQQFWTLRDDKERAEWAANYVVDEVAGHAVGIIGLGDLGGCIARLFRPFGVHLRALRRGGTPSDLVDTVYATPDLDSFLMGLDVLVIAAPLTPETQGLIGAAQLARLPRGAFLVNVGRGPIVDEQALLDALQSGHLGGAALDVFWQEPLPPTSPFWRLPNVQISPHCADRTPAAFSRCVDVFLDNLTRFQRGEPLNNVVDRSAGY